MNAAPSQHLLAKLVQHGTRRHVSLSKPCVFFMRSASTHRLCVSKMLRSSTKLPPGADIDASTKCKSLQLMLTAGLIQPADPGTFHLLPLAVRSLEKLIRVIDETMLDIGAQKIVMPCLTKADLWKTSGRWDVMGAELFRLKDRYGMEYCLGPTHEEAVTSILGADKTISYTQLPQRLYQITTKFRDEVMPRFGLLRGREFCMKDMYTFDSTETDAMQTYNAVCQAYRQLFDKLGVDCLKAVGDSGAIGGNVSHEYHFIASTGEDEVFLCKKCGLAQNREVVEEDKPECPESLSDKECRLETHRAIEVGHTFYLGTKYSKVFNVTYTDDSGQERITEMGCYGLGVSRILAACVEVLSTGAEIRWPTLIAPYQVYIIPPKGGSKEAEAIPIAESLYDDISQLPGLKGEVLFDDRYDRTIGKRLKDATVMGYPYVIIVGKKALQQDSLFELMRTNTGTTTFVTKDELIRCLTTETQL